MGGSLVLLVLLAMNDGHQFPLDNVLVVRPAKVDERKAFEALPSIAVISEEPKQGLLNLAQQATAATPDVGGEEPHYILAAGPVLDGPDEVQVHSLTQFGRKIVLQVRHTSARLSGRSLRRNIQWRPLVQVPVKLVQGNWQVVAEWQPYSDLPNGTPLAAPLRQSLPINVQAAKSK